MGGYADDIFDRAITTATRMRKIRDGLESGELKEVIVDAEVVSDIPAIDSLKLCALLLFNTIDSHGAVFGYEPENGEPFDMADYLKHLRMSAVIALAKTGDRKAIDEAIRIAEEIRAKKANGDSNTTTNSNGETEGK